MPKHLLFLAAPAHGHVNPTLPVVSELLARGHRVTYATGPALTAGPANAGATVRELPWTLDPTALTRDGFTTASYVSLLEHFLESADAWFGDLLRECRDGKVDAVCFDAAVSPVAGALAELLGVPPVALIPSMAVNEHLPLAELLPPDFTPDNPALARYAGRLHAFAAEQGLSAPLAPMQVPPCPLTLVFVPAAFQMAAESFGAEYRFVGPTAARAERADWQAPPGEGPLVYVSLGTAFNDRPDVLAACVEAFAGTQWRLVMSLGRVGAEQLGSLPDNVRVAPFLPQLDVLRDAAVFVSHAGMNSVMESLASRVPLVTLPQVAEQNLNARRVHELGLGERLDTAVALTPERIREAVVRVSGDAGMRERLDWMAAEIGAAGGAGRAADLVLELLHA